MNKRLLILLLFPILSFGQIQIGEDIDGEAVGDELGSSVSLSLDGSIIAIGAPQNDGSGDRPGHVRVYENQGGNWIQIGQTIEGENPNDRSGSSISLSSDGSIVAIGVSRNDDNGQDSGHVRVYENQGGTWVQLGQDIDGEFSQDSFGRSVSLSFDGTIVAAGATGNDGNGNLSGHVRVYENQGGTWIQIGQDIDGEAIGDRSGNSISLSSDGFIVAIGAPGNADNGPFSGHVRVYENQGGTWVQIGQDIDGEATSDDSGSSISLSSDGTIIAIGASENDGNGDRSGHVRVYENQEGTWVQIGQDIDGGAISDQFGYKLSLSSNGQFIAVTTVNTVSGRVEIYKNQEGVWTQIGQDIDGEGDFDDSGFSINISSDANFVAIGAPQNDGNGESSGHVRVYDLSALLSTEEVTQTQFTIYPNPASTNVSIQLDQNNTLEKSSIYNNLGQLVKTSTEVIIDTSDLSKGIYIIEVTTDQGTSSKKLIIE